MALDDDLSQRFSQGHAWYDGRYSCIAKVRAYM